MGDERGYNRTFTIEVFGCIPHVRGAWSKVDGQFLMYFALNSLSLDRED